jgi:hypothetical protein
MNTPDNNFFIQSLLRQNPPKEYIWEIQALYYYNPQITFREVPDEISLTIPTLCCNPCSSDCNSKFCWISNWKEKKEELTLGCLLDLIEKNEGITCVTIMTSLNFKTLDYLFSNIKFQYPHLKTALYVGANWEDLLQDIYFHTFNFQNLDFLKIGSFDKNFGPLDNSNTNQRFYKINHLCKGKDKFENITDKFLQKPI